MKNLTEVATNKVLNEMVDAAVREAVKLQVEANKERAKQKTFEMTGEHYAYTAAHKLEQGVKAVCEVLWKIFGGCTADSIWAINKIVMENNSEILGYDCQDYIQLFICAFENRNRRYDYIKDVAQDEAHTL